MHKEQIPGLVQRYLNGEIDLQAWLLANLQSILDSGDQEAIQLANQIDAGFVELGEDLVTYETLLGELQVLTKPYCANYRVGNMRRDRVWDILNHALKSALKEWGDMVTIKGNAWEIIVDKYTDQIMEAVDEEENL